MNKKTLTIIGIIILAIIASSFLYIQKNNNITLENSIQESDVQQNNVIPDSDHVSLENSGEFVIDNLSPNKVKDIENELWNQLILESQELQKKDRINFSIESVNENQTIALGSYRFGHSGANIFAFRSSPGDEWIIEITQEALMCSDVGKLTQNQIRFMKKNHIDYCVEFEEEGDMNKKFF